MVGNGGDIDVRGGETFYMYGGTYKRYWTDNSAIISGGAADQEGFFPMGTEVGEYRPVEINSTANAFVDGVTGWFAVEHVDADKITELDAAQAEGLDRMSNAQFITSSSGITAGTFNIDISMTGLSSTGDGYPNSDVRLAKYAGPTTISVVGTHADATGTAAAPTFSRTALTFTELSANNDFRIATLDVGNDPLREMYYSRVSDDWNYTHPVNGTWSLESGGSGSSCNCLQIV